MDGSPCLLRMDQRRPLRQGRSLGRTKVIYMDNAAGQKPLETLEDPEEKAKMDAVVAEKHIEIQFLPANGTDLCQPADVSVIQKLKQVWRKKWCKEKLRLAQRNKFSNIPNQKGEWSGKLQQPGKTFFLELAARCCRLVSVMRDDDGVSVVRKGMIPCGLSKNLNGVWEECQLTPELQGLVAQHREYFDGKVPVDFCEALV